MKVAFLFCLLFVFVLAQADHSDTKVFSEVQDALVQPKYEEDQHLRATRLPSKKIKPAPKLHIVTSKVICKKDCERFEIYGDTIICRIDKKCQKGKKKAQAKTRSKRLPAPEEIKGQYIFARKYSRFLDVECNPELCERLYRDGPESFCRIDKQCEKRKKNKEH